MATTTITNLPTVTSLTGTEPLLGVQNGNSVQITTGQIAQLSSGTSGYLLSSVTQLSNNPIIGTPSSSTYLRGDGTWAAVSASATSIAVGITTVTSSTSGYILYNNAGTLGNLATTGSGSVTLNGSPTFTGTVTSPFYIATGAISGSLSAGAYSYGTLGYSDSNIYLSATSSQNSYTQAILQNTNSGASASVNYLVSNNLGTASTYFGEFGMNSSGFSGTGAFAAANAVYLDSTSADLVIGTTTSNAIHFVVNSGATDAATISSSGIFSLGTPLAVGSGGLGISTTPANGYIPIGNGTNYTAAALTAGSNITITNTAGGITIASTGGGGSGTVNSGTAGQLTYYASTGTAVSGNANATISNGALTLGVSTSVAGSLGLSGSTSGKVTLQTAAAAGTWSMTLPTTAGTNGYVLSTDGTGVTSWIATSGGGGTVTSVAQSFTGGIISVSGSPITGSGTLALTVAGTSGGIPYFGSASTWASSAALTANALMIGGGAGAAPATTTTGTGVLTALGNTTNAASGIVVKDANANITTNALYQGFTNAAATTTITLTASSTPNRVVAGSGGQTFTLPDATTLPVGATFTFNNNQSSGAITVNNNSSTLIVSIPSGGFATVILLTNSVAAGTWDYHFGAPANVSWSTNTFSYPGSITSATWNGNIIGPAYGGTGIANNAASTLTISGNFATTLTVSGTTSLTLPTSGTLATTANINTALPSATSSQIYIGTGSAGAAAAASTLPTAAFPALTGDVTNTAGSVATTVGKIGGNAVSLGGAFTLSGAFATTLTVTGTTTLTLPTSGTVTALGNTTTGSGSIVLATTPTLVTPVLGVATATSINGLTITSSTGTLTVTNAKTLSVSNTLTLAGTDSTTMTFPSTSTTVAGLGTTQTFTATNTFSQVNYTNNAVTVTSNAGTVPITYRLNTFTNSSAATMAITMAVTSAVDGQMSIVRIYDFSAAAQTIGWTNTENSTVSVPTTSNGSTTLPLTVGFMYNGQTSKWRCIASA